MKPNNTAAHELDKRVPPPRVYDNVTLHGEVVILCPNNATSSGSGSFDKTVLSPEDFDIGDHTSGVLTVKNHLDYEKTSAYILRLTISDRGRKITGKATLFVSVTRFIFYGSRIFSISSYSFSLRYLNEIT